MAARGAEALRDEVEPRVLLLERGSHTDSCRDCCQNRVFAGKFRVAAHLPTLTAVLLSSSEARLPPILLLMLRRLELRLGRTMALIGRFARGGGDVGGDSMVVRPRRRRLSRRGARLLCNAAVLEQACGEGGGGAYV